MWTANRKSLKRGTGKLALKRVMLVVVPRVDKREVGVEGEGQGGGPSSGPGEGSRWEEVMARTWREMKRVKGYSEGLHTDWL